MYSHFSVQNYYLKMATWKVLHIICKVSCTSNFYIMIPTRLIDLIPVVTEATVTIITVLGYKIDLENKS